MTSRRTLAEIQATCTKAARGAGCPWGLAEEAGMAARVLQSKGLPGAEALADLLTDGCCGGAAGCGILEMAALSDDPPQEAVTWEEVRAPLLLLAPLIWAGRGGRLDWAGGQAEVSAYGIVVTGEVPARGRVTFTPAGSAHLGPAEWQSQPVAPEVWAVLETLALATTVPETEHSRASGAGPDS